MEELSNQSSVQGSELLAFRDDSDFGRLEAQFDQFCPFEALGMVRAEIRHGNLLAYLFDPSRPHGFGKHGLRALLTSIAKTPFDGPPPLSLEMTANLNYDDAEIRREWHNIDILIVFPAAQLVLAVELKIDSSQHGDQLRRYRGRVEQTWPNIKGWKHVYVFMTKNEEAAHDIDYWRPVRLSTVANEIAAIDESVFDKSQAGAFIRSYVNMLRKHHLKNDKLAEITGLLWSKHKIALEYLMDHRPDAIGQIFELTSERLKELEESMLDRGMLVEFDSKSDRIIRFAFKAWDKIPEFRTEKEWKSKRLILLEIIREKESINICLTLGKSDSQTRRTFAQVLGKNRLELPSSKPLKSWIFLARSELIHIGSEDTVDISGSCEILLKNAYDFASRSYAHFSPLIEQLDLLPSTGHHSSSSLAVQNDPL